jgi:hypothetical protein
MMADAPADFISRAGRCRSAPAWPPDTSGDAVIDLARRLLSRSPDRDQLARPGTVAEGRYGSPASVCRDYFPRDFGDWVPPGAKRS